MPLDYHPLKIKTINATADDAVCVTFDVPVKLQDRFQFTAGQHLTLRNDIAGEELRRFYSICSQAGSDKLRIGVRAIAGGRFSGHLNSRAKVGDAVDVLAPRGRFCLTGAEKGLHILAFAAGSGITPVYSIIASHLAADPASTATLVFGNRHTGTIMLRRDLNDLKDRYLDRFQLVHILSREQQDIELLNGRIDKKTLVALEKSGLIAPVKSAGVFICGPSEMIDTVSTTLIELGCDERKIKFERFTGATTNVKSKPVARKPQASPKGAKVFYRLDGVEKQFAIEDAGDTLLEAAQKQRLELPFSCAGGMCATCRCKLVSGKVDMAINYALAPWELEAGFILACQSRAASGEIRVDFDMV